jgi:hypothetical protein
MRRSNMLATPFRLLASTLGGTARPSVLGGLEVEHRFENGFGHHRQTGGLVAPMLMSAPHLVGLYSMGHARLIKIDVRERHGASVLFCLYRCDLRLLFDCLTVVMAAESFCCWNDLQILARGGVLFPAWLSSVPESKNSKQGEFDEP